MPVGDIDPVFLSNLVLLQQDGLEIAAATTNGGVRSWMLGDLSLWAGSPLAIDTIGAVFDREALGETFADAMADDEGSLGDMGSALLQSDHLAVQERAFRLRHASPVRCRLHAASRRLGHSQNGGVLSRVAAYAQDILVAGNSGFVPRDA